MRMNSRPRHRRTSRRPIRPLHLERLEDRSLMAAIAPPDGIVSWWTGDNTTADLLGRNDAALFNGGAYATGQVGNGFNFDGSDDNLQASTAGLPTGSADRTVELWARIDQQVAGESFFASYGAPGVSNQAYALGTLSDGRLFVSTWQPAIFGPTLQNNRWYHVAATNVGTSFKLYLDGVEVAAGTMPVETPAGSTFWMGRQTMSTLGDSRRLDGTVDEVSVYDRALSGAEIQAIYNAGSDGKIKSPTYVTADFPSVIEGSSDTTTVATFTIRRVGDLTGEATVNWETADGTAVAGSDYVAASGTFVFQDGQSQQPIDITVNGDNLEEANEAFNLILTTSTPGYAVSGGRATILNDDVTVSITNNVTTDESNLTVQYQGNFASAREGGLDDPHDMIYGPDGNLYVSTRASNGVLRYDAVTGEPRPAPGKSGAEFVSPGAGGLSEARGMGFGADGNLYVVSLFTSSVLRFDAATGAPLGDFIAPSAVGLSYPRGLLFHSDGYLYVTSTDGGTGSAVDSVLRYDAITGAPAGISGQPGDAIFIASGSGGLDNPSDIVFHNGSFYVASTAPSTSNSVLKFGTDGSFLGTFVPSGSGGLAGPSHLVFQGNDLYVSSWTNNKILRFNGTTGAFVDQIASGEGLARPASMLFHADGTLLVASGDSDEIRRYGIDAFAVFTISLSAPMPGSASVSYATASGTAVAGSDYVTRTGTIQFAPGEWTKTVAIPIVDDLVGEPNEAFVINLSGATGAAITNGQGVATIVDDDPGPTKFYVVNDGAPDRTYEYGSKGKSIENYSVNTGNTAPRGAVSTAAGDKVWVVDANKKVYVYNTSGVMLGSWTAGGLTGSAQVEGIATNGTDVWLVDAKADKVYRYTNAASRISGTQNAASSFTLFNKGPFSPDYNNSNPKDIVTDGNYLWVLNDGVNEDKLFKYTLTGTAVWNNGWTLDTASSQPTGVTLDPANPNDFWIVDKGTHRVYRYAGAVFQQGGGLPHTATDSFALAAGNTNPQGIADPPPPSAFQPIATPSKPAVAAEAHDQALLRVIAELAAYDWPLAKKRR